MKKNLLTLSLISLLSMAIVGCGDKGEETSNKISNSNDTEISVSSEEEISYSFEQKEDIFDLLPDDVLNAQCDIDFLVYIEGQNGTIKDIGNYYCGSKAEDAAEHGGTPSRKYHAEDITSIEMARWFGAAQAFKEIAPGVKINLIYCSIAEYPDTIKAYNTQKGHLPQLMWGTDHVVEMLQQGYNTDLSKYSDSEYYKQYNEYFMSRFNYGGFQAGIPIAAEPWGVFVNTDILEECYIIGKTIDEYGECSDEYKAWVDDFTWDNFVDAVKRTNTPAHAGLSKVVDYFLSYSVESINKQFVENGTVDLTSSAVESTIEKLINYENELTQYCVYAYDDASTGQTAKEDYPNAHNWSGNQNFVDDQYCTFYAEAPWALATISQYVTSEFDTTGRQIETTVDFLPYPKVDSSANAYTGIAVEGLTVGNQCPIGTDGKEHCASEKSKLETDVAAYFAMFAGVDPRSTEAKSKIKYIVNGKNYTGSVGLPIIKRNNKYDWQSDPEILAKYNDPAADFEDNWQYDLSLFFKVNNLYVTDGQEPDVVNFSNIMYGLVKMLDSMYMIYGDEVTCINYWNEPVLVPDGTETRNVFLQWLGRYTRLAERTDDGNASGLLGLADYPARVAANIADIEEDINENAALAWALLQEQVDMYYGEGYDVLDPDYRNSYEGHK